MPENWIHEIVSVKTPPIPSVWGQTFSRELTVHLHRIQATWDALAANGQADAWGSAESLQVVCAAMFGHSDLYLVQLLGELIEKRAIYLGEASAEGQSAGPPPDFPP